MKKKSPKTKKILKKPSSFYLILGLSIIMVIGSLAFIKTKRSFAPIDINQVGVTSGVVDLTLTPATSQVEPGGELILTLTANPGTYQVGDITVELTYDQTKVGTPILTQGSYLADKMGTPSVAGGKINFEYVAPTSGLATGSGTVATIKLFPQGSGSTAIAFTDKTEVVVVDPATNSTVPSNMLKSAGSATITIGTAAASASPSTTPARPAKPTGLRHNCFDGGNKITLRWDAVSGVDSYKLRLDQKDGTGDKSIDGLKVTEGETAIIPDQKYSWWVHSSKDGVDSEEAKIDEIICAKSATSTTTVSTPSPTPTPTPKSTVKPTIKTTPKPSVKSSAKPSPSTASTITASIIPIESPRSIGSLNDIFKDADALETTTKSTTKPGFFQMLGIGWQAIFQQLAQLFK
jgi:hypothetical protein